MGTSLCNIFHPFQQTQETQLPFKVQDCTRRTVELLIQTAIEEINLLVRMQKSDTITLLSIGNYYPEVAFLKSKFQSKFSFFFGCQLGKIFKISLHLSGA